eukprot:TRINITY_DN14645_c0_g1_i1.p1 TRINITY_DN14645_c0_g1~~TRINITY_DN14645_c0_g1_i1.p1  ORF type:complete len:720 (-),score=194.53 TRINITY_DN14645_c0_g1_i1:6-2165(-)
MGKGLLSDEEKTAVDNVIKPREKREVTFACWGQTTVKKKKVERIVAVGKWRLYYLSFGKKGPKILNDNHLMELKSIKSSDNSTISIEIGTISIDLESVESIKLITAIRHSYEQIAFSIPTEDRFKLDVTPESLSQTITPPAADSLSKSSGGFSLVYQSTCNLLNVPAREDVCWDMDHLLPSNRVTEFNMKEFEQPVTPGDFKALIESLSYNNYFTGFVVRDYKLDKAAIKVIADMLSKNSKIQELVLSNIDADASGFDTLALFISTNKNCALTSIDWSNNSVQDKGLIALAKVVGSLKLVSLNIANTDGTSKKGLATLVGSMAKNTGLGDSLKNLNLSNNRLEEAGSVPLAQFLSTAKSLVHLNLANTAANLEVILEALSNQSELQSLNLSGNKFNPKIGAVLKKYLSGAKNLRELTISNTMVDVQTLKNSIFKEVSGNQNLKDFKLDISGNKLSVLGANMIAGVAESLSNIKTLLAADNDFGDEGLIILCDALQNNTCITELNISDNFRTKTKQRSEMIDSLCQLLSCGTNKIEKLDIAASSADQALKYDLIPVLYTLPNNGSIRMLNIMGHCVGDRGGIALGKSIQTNQSLEVLYWDNNWTRIVGLQAFKLGLERNTQLTVMPLPILDVAEILKANNQHAELVRQILLSIEKLLFRNQTLKRRAEGGSGGSGRKSLDSSSSTGHGHNNSVEEAPIRGDAESFLKVERRPMSPADHAN